MPITREASFAIVRFYDGTSEFLRIATAINPVREEAFYRVEGEGVAYAYKLDFSKADATHPEALIEGTVAGKRLIGTFNTSAKTGKTNISLPKLPVKTMARLAYFEGVFTEMQDYYTKEKRQSGGSDRKGLAASGAQWHVPHAGDSGAAGGAARCVGTALAGCVVCAGAFGAGASVCKRGLELGIGQSHSSSSLQVSPSQLRSQCQLCLDSF